MLNDSESIELNRPITMDELTKTIKDTKSGKAYGPDEITYKFYKNAPYNMLKQIKKSLNSNWLTGHFPNEFKSTLINPIPKPGKILKNKLLQIYQQTVMPK